MANKKNQKKGGKTTRRYKKRGGSAASYGVAAYGTNQVAVPPIAGNESNFIKINPPMSGGDGAAQHAINTYGGIGQQTSIGQIAGNESNLIKMQMSGGDGAAQHAINTYGGIGQQTSIGQIAGNESNLIKMQMSGGAALGYGDYPLSTTTLLNPTQTGVVLAANNSAHSGTDSVSQVVRGGNPMRGHGGNAGILTDMAVPASLILLNQLKKRRSNKKSRGRGGNAGILTDMAVPASLILLNQLKKRRSSKKRRGGADEDPAAGMKSMQKNFDCQQNGPSAQIARSAFGSSLPSAVVNCNTKGGSFINDAIVPAALLLANNTLGKRLSRRKQSKKR